MDRFDHIVVGAGSAGCVLAARLSEDPQNRVLLLEAGPAGGPRAVAVPPEWPTLIGSEVDWGDATVPQPSAAGGARLYPRGKVLGGSSSINGMAFLRGHHSNYDEWAATGATGWGYADLLPYFKRTETAEGRDPAYRGTDGPLRVAPVADPNPLAFTYVGALDRLGYRPSDDLNGADQEGFGWWDLNIVDGTRQSAADAYLRPVLGRPNLTVVTGALVRRVIVDGDRCTAVEYAVDGALRRAYPEKETILSAGSIGSAQVLLLSGIGPADHLRGVGLEVVADLPGVGANLHDHPLAGVTYAAARPVPPARGAHGDLVAAVRSTPELEAPDLHLLLLDVPFYPPSMPGTTNGYTIACAAMQPHSRGSVRLAGPDPATPPLIDPGFLADDRDLVTLLTGVDMARELGGSAAFEEWRGEEVLPGPDLCDGDELRDYLRQVTDPYHHPVGTCRIGTDPGAVVDPELRVRGIDGLRVADASVMPSIVGANTNATVLAIAERAATLLSGSGIP